MSHPATSAVIDAAAALFARYGFTRTSVQAVADATDYSKAGLLHHFPTKLALHKAVLEECRRETERVRDRVADLAVGEERDHRSIELLVDLSLARPGLASLLLSTIVPMGDDDVSDVEPLGDILFEAFDTEPMNDARRIRVTGALVALGVLALEARRSDCASPWRNEIIATSIDTLGRSGSSYAGTGMREGNAL
ncbi:TetR/AcrR family transcriptional regulator [Pseudoclavibacter sp. AY1F1]|uniref:TetR/AcrR family transcriptional regulator n=1 Tax=Pseudoclavibacter sp. AY1F1 TaxID=2080583 RepID=UPI000CE8FD26|nr:helix-turn-helix domain-containing protein [Pseudoclavibacter sp. AY1F1]PPF43363.1 TetR/AcrR family transcriptional regulator [Pseudoclavibacter sp. AY1F1]